MSRTARCRDSLVLITAATVVGTAVLAWALTAKAEDVAKGQPIWQKGKCSICHGWSGDVIVAPTTVRRRWA
jgi:hypothetical protein